MKRRQPTTLSVLMTAVAIVAAAALLSATAAPHNLAFAEKGGNGKGNNGNGKGNGGGNGSGNGNNGNGNSGNGNNGNGNGNNGNGNANGNNKGSDDDGSSGEGDSADGGAPSGPSGATPNGRSAGGHDRIVRSEVVVTDASKGLAAFARAKGFQVVHTESLAALDLDVTRLRAPPVSPPNRRVISLRGSFPIQSSISTISMRRRPA